MADGSPHPDGAQGVEGLDDFPPALVVSILAVTHRGAVRSANEDCLGAAMWVLSAQEASPLELTIRLETTQLFLVADGMGGHRGGAEASRMAVDGFLRSQGSIASTLEAVSDTIHDRAEQDLTLRGMGTTLVGVRLSPDGGATVFNVGDSRAYRLVDGYLGQLSVDDRPALRSRENVGVVTQSLGGSHRTTFDTHESSFRVAAGERMLLCTDGLHDVLDDERIGELLLLPAAEAASHLLSDTLAAGAPDNVSFLLLDVHGKSAP